MSTITAKAAGAFSATGTWNGDVVPSGANIADANGYAVSITSDVACGGMQNTGGGGFTLDISGLMGPRSINVGAGTFQIIGANLFTISGQSPVEGPITFTGNFVGESSGGYAGVTGTTPFNLVINGNLTAKKGILISHSSASDAIIVTGNVVGGDSGTGSSHAISCACPVTVTGNVTGNLGFGNGIQNTTAASAVVVVGSVMGDASQYGVSAGANSVTVSGGNVTGGAGGNGAGISVTTGAVNVTGNVTGGAGAASPGIIASGAAPIAITGVVTGGAGAISPAVNAPAGTVTVNSNNIVDTLTSAAIVAGKLKWNVAAGNTRTLYKTDNTALTFISVVDVVAAGSVVLNVARYVGGTVGSYPTNESVQATDIASVTSYAKKIERGTTILTVPGTLGAQFKIAG